MSIDDDMFEVEAYLEKRKKAPIEYWNRHCKYVVGLEMEVDELQEHNSVLRAALQAGQNHLIQDIMDLVMFQDIHEVQLTSTEDARYDFYDAEQQSRFLIMKTLEARYGVSLRTKAQRNKESSERKDIGVGEEHF